MSATLEERLLADARMNEEIPVKTHLHDTAVLEREAASEIARQSALVAELAEALSALVYWHDQDGRIDESWWQNARDLLAKAKGETK